MPIPSFHRKWFVPLGLLLVLMGYSNCGRINSATLLDAQSLGRDVCSDRLKTVYESTYFPFVSDTNRCHQCHSSSFGSRELNVSFSAFLARSVATVDFKAVTAHGGNSNSPANQPFLDAFKPAYTSGWSEYKSCKARLGGGQYTDIPLSGKVLPTLPDHDGKGDEGWVDMSWTVSTDANPLNLAKYLDAILKLQVRKYVSNGKLVGLQFRRPRITLLGSQKSIQIGAVRISFDGTVDELITAYDYLDKVVNTYDETLLSNAGATFTVRTWTAETLVGLELRSVGPPLDGASGDGGAVPNPIDPGTPLPNIITWTQLTEATGDYGVFAKYCVSCHSGANPRGGLNLENYSAAAAGKSEIESRIADSNRPMPPSGLLTEQSIQIVNQWIKSGTPEK